VKKLKWLIFFFSAVFHLQAQQLAFRHLDVNDGLSSNVVSLVAFDRNGSLWFSTGESINFFDGNNVFPFHWRNNPVFPQAESGFFSVDSYNRVWICYSDRTILINEKRQPELISIRNSYGQVFPTHCFDIKGLGVVAVSGKGTYYSTDIRKPWNRLAWFDSLQAGRSFVFVNRFDSSSVIIKLSNRLLVVNFSLQKIMLDMEHADATEACRLNDDEILVAARNQWRLYRFSLSQQKIIKTYTEAALPDDHLRNAKLQKLERAANGKIYIATLLGGLAEFDVEKESWTAYRPDNTSSFSLSSDNIRFIAANPAGYLAVSSWAGINIANVFQQCFLSKEKFITARGNIVDEYVSGIAEDHKQNLWLMTQTRILRWNRRSNTVDEFFNLSDVAGKEQSNLFPGIPAVDDEGRIWLPYTGYGILVYNDEGKRIRTLTEKSDGFSSASPVKFTRVIKKNSDGRMVAGCENGIFMIDPKTFFPDTVTLKPLLDSMRVKRVVSILPEKNSLWVSTSINGAVYHFHAGTKAVKIFTEKNGLPSSRHYMLAKDNAGTIYAGNYAGLSIIGKKGEIKVIDEHSGLIDHRVESIMPDDSEYVWIGNRNILIRYHPATGQFDYFNEQNGINKAGFSISSVCKTKSGEIVFGTFRGLIIVNPANIIARKRTVSFTLYRLNTDNSVDMLSQASALRLPFSNGRVSFGFSNSDLVTGRRIFYRYKMQGTDSTWSAPTKNQLVTYNLRPGRYRFFMQASYNNTAWMDFPESIAIRVNYPFWQQWWFYIIIGVLAVGVTLAIYRSAQASKEQKRKLEELNHMMNESRLMAIRAQMNPHFIFNSLNSIQECIVMQDFDTAYQYLSKFSKLLRQVLNNSEKNFIPLKDEIEVNELYLELESLRFKKSFSYHFEIDEKIDTEAVQFPSLMLQPFIENAVWHGLMHKQGEKKLSISFQAENNHLVCIIEDNGIGREKAAEIKKNKLGARYLESKGTKLSEQRLQLLNESGQTRAKIHFEDLKSGAGEAAGTKVILEFPFDYKS
jgi:ligand-binding sensor domain-containing protein